MMRLVVDNTRTIPPDLPDLYEGVAANDDADMPVGVAFAIALGAASQRLGRISFWIALGVVAGLLI